jgi:hypothetical protein
MNAHTRRYCIISYKCITAFYAKLFLPFRTGILIPTVDFADILAVAKDVRFGYIACRCRLGDKRLANGIK